jgi:hypothetical protein
MTEDEELPRKLFHKLWAYRADWQDMGYIGNAMEIALSREELEWVMRQAVQSRG